MGERDKAQGKIYQMLQREKERYVPPYNIALVLAGLKEFEAAAHWLGRAVEERDVHLTFLRDHKWDILRSRPEFRALVARVGLPD